MSKILLLCVDVDGTMTDGSLICGFMPHFFNASLELHSADLANFGHSQTPSLASRPKFAKNHESQTENPSVVLNAESAESSLRGVTNAEAIKKDKIDCHDSPKANLAMTENSVDCHENSLRSFSRNDESNKNASIANANSSIVSEKSGLRSHEREDKTWCLSPKRVASLPDLSPQDEFAEIIKVFNVKDGLALAYWAKTLNRKVAIITGRSSEILLARAKELGISELLFMGIRDKGAKVRELKERFALDSSQIATIGDDLNDIPMFKESYCNFAPSDCADALKSLPHTTILNAKGGGGAVREAIEIILKKESLYEAFVSQFV